MFLNKTVLSVKKKTMVRFCKYSYNAEEDVDDIDKDPNLNIVCNEIIHDTSGLPFCNQHRHLLIQQKYPKICCICNKTMFFGECTYCHDLQDYYKPIDFQIEQQAFPFIKPPEIIKSFKDTYFFLSNFYPLEFNFNDYTCKTAEHAFQACKTTVVEEIENILQAETPKEAKKRGHTVTLRSDWEEIKYGTMYNIVYEKFKTYEMQQKLLLTGFAPLIEENSWHDNTWGSCFCQRCNFIEGQNLLGKILMSVRETLQIRYEIIQNTLADYFFKHNYSLYLNNCYADYEKAYIDIWKNNQQYAIVIKKENSIKTYTTKEHNFL